jgi:hypothetical protein
VTAGDRPRPSVVNALQAKIEVYNRLLEREDAEKKSGLEAQVLELQWRLHQFDNIDPAQIATLNEETRTLRVELENSRAGNRILLSERDTARQQTGTVTSLLKWLVGRVDEPKRFELAVRVFVEHGRDAKILVDALTSSGTCAEWEGLATSKQKLVLYYRENKNARDPESQQTVDFCKTYLAAKHSVDIEAILREETEKARQQEERESNRHDELVFQRELAASRARRDAAREMEIRRAENDQYRPASRMGGVEQW